MKRPPGGPTVATTKQQEESLAAPQCWGGGSPVTGHGLGKRKPPAWRGDAGHPGLYLTRVCFRLPSQPQADSHGVSTLGPKHPGALQPSSSGGTKGGLPRSQAIQLGAACISPSGPDAADLSAILGGQDD